jgi:hypothetical protein
VAAGRFRGIDIIGDATGKIERTLTLTLTLERTGTHTIQGIDRTPITPTTGTTPTKLAGIGTPTEAPIDPDRAITRVPTPTVDRTGTRIVEMVGITGPTDNKTPADIETERAITRAPIPPTDRTRTLERTGLPTKAPVTQNLDETRTHIMEGFGIPTDPTDNKTPTDETDRAKTRVPTLDIIRTLEGTGTTTGPPVTGTPTATGMLQTIVVRTITGVPTKTNVGDQTDLADRTTRTSRK